MSCHLGERQLGVRRDESHTLHSVDKPLTSCARARKIIRFDGLRRIQMTLRNCFYVEPRTEHMFIDRFVNTHTYTPILSVKHISIRFDWRINYCDDFEAARHKHRHRRHPKRRSKNLNTKYKTHKIHLNFVYFSVRPKNLL